MSAFRPLPLGQPIPDRLHAVSCSLPTMRDVIGYEERDPAITAHLTTGYPRFVLHPCVRELTTHLAATHHLTAHTLWLTCSSRMADQLATWLGHPPDLVHFHDGDLFGLAHASDPDLALRARRALQNAGGFLSSRAAEEQLVARGLRPALTPETLAPADTAAATIHAALDPAFPATTAADRFLAPNGMNAVHAGWRAAADLQATRGRTVWLQLGWLYLDTIALLRRLVPTPADYVYLPDVHNLPALRAAITTAGDRFAGLVTEASTNPLVQTPNLPSVATLVRAAGGLTLIDPSLVSPLAVNVLPHADLITNSLTKYTASEGDLVAGLVVVNPTCPDAAALRVRVAAIIDPLHPRDLRRLAAQIGDYPAVVSASSNNAARVAAFLRDHPAIAELHWTGHPASAAHYETIARHPGTTGSVLSFRLRGGLARFYDRLTLPKGPSFGMKTTLICPFIYLAHYDLVTTPEGRAELAASGLSPDLLRLALGCEPAETIIAALAAALA